MIRLLPNISPQIMRIIPRNIGDSQIYALFATEEDTNKQIELTISKVEVVGNYTEFTIDDIFTKEDSMYSLLVTNDNELCYRDKLYVTSKENTDKYHKIDNTEYKSKDSSNEYITI